MDPEFRRRIEKYDKIIYEYELKKYNDYCNILNFCNNYKPKNNIELLMKDFIKMQNKMIIEKLDSYGRSNLYLKTVYP